MNLEHFLPERTRRAFLAGLRGAAAALLVPSLARAERAAGNGRAFSFFQLNDLHYVDADCGRWFTSMVEQMKASAPEAQLCLLCGDLADRGAESALKGVRDAFNELALPLLPVPGNHDFTPEESRAGYDAIFPGKLNYSIKHEGWQFVGLDTTMGTKYEKTTIADAMLAWLDDEIPRLDPKAPTVVFTHFPLGEGVTYRPLNAPAVIERLLKLNLLAVFSGHWHGASERRAAGALLTTSRCCARVRNNADRSPMKGWFICDARADGTLTRRFVEFRAPAEIPTSDAAAPKPAAK